MIKAEKINGEWCVTNGETVLWNYGPGIIALLKAIKTTAQMRALTRRING